MKIKYLIASIALFVSVVSSAQYGYTGFTYSMAVPTVGLEDYIGNGSYRGATFEGHYNYNEHIALGWVAGWNVFNEVVDKATYINENVTLTGTQYRYENLFPMQIRGLYQFGDEFGIRPYLGIGTGVIARTRRTEIGMYSFSTTAWHFAVTPEAGILIPIDQVAFVASVRYNYGVVAKKLDQVSYVSFNMGFIFEY